MRHLVFEVMIWHWETFTKREFIYKKYLKSQRLEKYIKELIVKMC